MVDLVPQLPEDIVKRTQLAQDLLLTPTELDFGNTPPIKWPGIEYLRGLVEDGRSCLIMGPTGTGKSAAIVSLSPCIEDPEFKYLNCIYDQSTWELWRILWERVGRPVPETSDRIGDLIGTRNRQEWLGIDNRSPSSVCLVCSSRCIVFRKSKNCVFFQLPDESDLRAGLGSTERSCPLLVRLTLGHLNELHDLTFVIRIPDDADQDVYEALRVLLTNNVVILLGNENQIQKLKRLPIFDKLHCYYWPKPTFGLLKTMTQERLPIVSDNLILLAGILSDQNIQKYINLLSEAIIKNELNPQGLLKLVNWPVRPESKIVIAVASLGDFKSTTTQQVGDRVYEYFNDRLTDTTTGTILNLILERKRTAKGVEYRRKNVDLMQALSNLQNSNKQLK